MNGVTRQWKVGVLIVLAAALIQASGFAQSEPAGGKLKDKVVGVLKATAEGTCPEELMNATLLDQCEQQLGVNQEHFASLGPIKEARYKGKERLQNGIEVEVYRVVFTHGSMTWSAAAGPNGKLSVLWSPR